MLLPLLVPFLLWISGCCTARDAITGPATVRGQEQGSLTVQCRYDPYWKRYKKYWCRGPVWKSCEILVLTDTTERLVKKNRVSIRDDQTGFIVTVTMEELRMSDADTYWCAIERTGSDRSFEVGVSIDPAPQTPTTVLTTLRITSTTIMSTAPAAVNETTMFSTLTNNDSDTDRHKDGDDGDSDKGLLDLSVLLPVISAVLLILLLLASLFAWRLRRRQKKPAEPSSEQVLQSLDGDLCYANLSPQQPRTSPGSSRKKGSSMSSSGEAHQEEVEYVTMAPIPRQEVSYAALSLAALGQEPTYGNTGFLGTHIPRMSLDKSTEYSSIKRP